MKKTDVQGVEEGQRNLLFPDLLRNGREVAARVWKGSDAPPLFNESDMRSSVSSCSCALLLQRLIRTEDTICFSMPRQLLCF